jgi:hypothetical protein
VNRSSTVAVASPLASYAVEIDDRLTALGYAQSTRRQVQLQLSALSRWLQEIGLPAAKLTGVVVEHFREDCAARGITVHVWPWAGWSRCCARLGCWSTTVQFSPRPSGTCSLPATSTSCGRYAVFRH